MCYAQLHVDLRSLWRFLKHAPVWKCEFWYLPKFLQEYVQKYDDSDESDETDDNDDNLQILFR